jgi:hypothetical protein
VLTIGTVTLDEADAWRQPPRPQHSLPARRNSFHRTFDSEGLPGEVIQDFGQDLSKVVRLASSETIGFLTWEEVQELEALYASGLPFTLSWDRLGAAGVTDPSPLTFTAQFEPGVVPLFTLANEQKDYWLMDIVLRITPAEEPEGP